MGRGFRQRAGLPVDSPYRRFPLAARAMRMDIAGTALPAPAAQAPRSAAAAVPARTRLNWPLYLFLFLLPLQNIQTGYLPNYGYGLNFLNVMFVASLIGALVVGGKIASDAVNRWVWIYAAYSVISLFIGFQYIGWYPDNYNVLKDHLIGVFVVFLVQMSVRNWRDVRNVVLATILPLPYIAKVTWIEHQSVSSWHYSDDLRISGTFSLLGANEFAAFCVTSAAMLVALLLATRCSRIWRLLLIGGIACMVMGILYSYSRTAYISSLLALVMILLVWRGRMRLIVPLCLVLMVLPGLLPTSVTERFDDTHVEAGKRDESTEMRIVYWGIAWKNFEAHPMTGTGFQTFHHRKINPYGKDTHNLFMRTLTEGGLIGGAVLLGLLLSVLFAAMREVRVAPPGSWHYGIALGMMAAWIGLVCSNVFGDRFTYYPVIAYFWAYVALLIKARHLPPETAT